MVWYKSKPFLTGRRDFVSLLTCNQNWYGEDARFLQNESDCTIVEIKCEGTGIITDYRVFPGINLIFMDFNCTDVFREPRQEHDFIDIRHYQEGRVEFEFENRRVVHMQQDEFCINSMSTVPATYSFPFGHCSGVSLLINQDALTRDTLAWLNAFDLDIYRIENTLDLNKRWYIYKTPSSLYHVFGELYAAKGKAPVSYFKIKVLELLYHVAQLKSEDRAEMTYYSKEHIDIVKRIRENLVADPESKVSLETLLAQENISIVTFHAVFKQIYGDTPYAHVKNYKMNYAAVKLRESSDSVSQIGLSLGYSNASKFSKAFLDVIGVLPKDYRKQFKGI